jgi:hypothetical protein
MPQLPDRRLRRTFRRYGRTSPDLIPGPHHALKGERETARNGRTQPFVSNLRESRLCCSLVSASPYRSIDSSAYSTQGSNPPNLSLSPYLGGIAQVWVGPSPERIWELDSKVAALLGSADRLQRKVAGYREAEQRCVSLTPPSRTSAGVTGLGSSAASSSPDDAGVLPVATAQCMEPPLWERGFSFPGGATAAAAEASGGCSGTRPVGAADEMQDGQAAEQIDIAAHQAQLLRAAQHAQLDGQLVDVEMRRAMRRQLLASVNRCLQQQGSGDAVDVESATADGVQA